VTQALIRMTASPSAERRQLTVLFCDLVGSTALSTRLDPEDLGQMIGAYHRVCAAEVSRFGGYVARYMGDGVLAYFGYPQAHEDDAERAVRSGLALLEAVGKLSAPFDFMPQVRIGIATGLVVVGDLIGEGAAQEHAAMGETPNLAARLQTLADPNTVVISSSTQRLTRGLFEYRDLGPVTLRGFDAPMRVWRVLGTSSAQSRFEALRDAELTPLVGRNEEMALLLRRWREAEAGEGRVAVLVGEPGIGKSRIAREFEARLIGEAHITLRFFCSPHHHDSALFPIISHLERSANLAREDSAEEKLCKLEALLTRVPTEPEAIGRIAGLLALPTDGHYRLPELSPQRRKEKMLEALLAQVVGPAARQAVLLLFEDVHWIDPTSLELLTLIVERISRLRVLVIVTARPQFTIPWAGLAHVTMMSLTRLNQRDGLALVDRVTRGKGLPGEVLEQILARTDGVPLFIEELTKTVLESGLLREEDGRYALSGPLPELAIPTTLHDSLIARLDRRAPVREVVQAGAAIGREFSYTLLSGVAGLPGDKLRTALDELVRSELVFARDEPPRAVYSFKHALVRDAAYDALLRSRRQELHTRIAAVLEERFPEIVAQQPELLAQHCTQAGLTERAIAYWGKAGRKSVAHSTMTEAVAQLRRGLDLVSSLPDSPKRARQELDLQTTIGPALIVTKGFAAPQVEQAYARARELCRQMGETSQLITVLWGLWSFYAVRAELQIAKELADQFLTMAERQQDPALSVTAHVTMAVLLHNMGEPLSARAHLEQGLALYDPQQHHFLISRFGHDEGLSGLVFAAHTLWYLGYPDQAMAKIGEALSLARELSHPLSLANALDFRAWLHIYRREAAPAQEQAEADLALSAEQGFEFFVAHGTAFRGWALVELGREEEGIAQICAGLAAYRATGAELERSYFLGLLAEAYGKVGRHEEGLRVVGEALAEVHKHGVRFYEAELYRLKGELLLIRNGGRGGSRTSAIEEAEIWFRLALEMARRQQAKSLELRATISLSRLWQQQGKRDAAHELLADVYGWFTEGLDTADLREARALLDELA
jgi:class 3 adenylate cyclase/predicted ATPase